MALVTLELARQHLRITADDPDSDVLQKAAAASAAILRYLRGRRLAVTSLTSAGLVATVVTPVSHGLTSLDTVQVWGTDQSAYNGTFTITVVDANTFTFPVYGSPASPATGYIGVIAAFGWTAATVPDDVKHGVLLLLTDYYENRGDTGHAETWTAVERLLSSYRMPALA